jgi:hypothetical protein
MPLRETLFNPGCLLSTVTVTLIDSNYVNRSASFKGVRIKSTEANDSLHLECMRIRQPPYEIVADGCDEGGTSRWIVSFCERLAGVGGRGCGQKVASGGFQVSTSVDFK